MTKEDIIYGRKTWGPILWHLYHTFAIHLNTKKDIEYFTLLNNCFGYVLPCEECKTHYNFITEKIYTFDDTMNPQDAFYYTYKIHEMVNESLDKKNIPYEKAYRIHKTINNDECLFIVKTIYHNLEYQQLSLFEFDKIMHFFIAFCEIYPDPVIRKHLKKLINSSLFQECRRPLKFKQFIFEHFLTLLISKR